jgi:hypothetical protein
MRNCDPHDDPPAKRRPDAYRGLPVTLGYMRAHGVRRLLIYCSDGLYCHARKSHMHHLWARHFADQAPRAWTKACRLRHGVASKAVHPLRNEQPAQRPEGFDFGS